MLWPRGRENEVTGHHRALCSSSLFSGFQPPRTPSSPSMHSRFSISPSLSLFLFRLPPRLFKPRVREQRELRGSPLEEENNTRDARATVDPLPLPRPSVNRDSNSSFTATLALLFARQQRFSSWKKLEPPSRLALSIVHFSP